MVATGIDRAPTEAERAEMQIVGEKTPSEIFYAELSKKGQEFVKNHLPFDFQCARIDYEDEVEKRTKESERTYGYVRHEVISSIKLDLDAYGKESRFEIVEKDEEVEMQNINNVRTSVKVGWTVKYRCKQRGHGVSVFMPNAIYEERFGDKKKVDKKED